MARHRVFLALLALTAALRLAILFRAQTHVHSDEAIIGLMGMRILDGRMLPVYMAGQVFNGGAAMEAYLAAASFALFGAGVAPLKGCVVLLSLLGLVALHATVRRFWDERTALVAAAIYALAPTLLRWHFQVRGYGPYLLSIPVLFGLFLLLLTTRPRALWPFAAFGAVAGLSLWAMELVLPVVAAAVVLLALRRALPARGAAVALGGAVAGYLPALLFNFTHGLASWKDIAARKLAAEPVPVELSLPRLVQRFLFVEMPRFFGADTVMWYFPERSATGAVWAIAFLVALVLAVWIARRRVPGFLRDHLLRKGEAAAEDPTLYAVVLLGAGSLPYFAAHFRVAGYLIGAYPFIAVILASAIAPLLAGRAAATRAAGGAALAILLLLGLYEAGRFLTHGSIDTLVTDAAGNTRMRRIPAADIDGMLGDLRDHGARFVQASAPFQYPIVFETGGSIHASAALFGWNRRLFPDLETPPEGDPGTMTLVVETGMPVRRVVELPSPAEADGRLSERRFGAVTVIRLAPPAEPGAPVPGPGT